MEKKEESEITCKMHTFDQEGKPNLCCCYILDNDGKYRDPCYYPGYHPADHCC